MKYYGKLFVFAVATVTSFTTVNASTNVSTRELSAYKVMKAEQESIHVFSDLLGRMLSKADGFFSKAIAKEMVDSFYSRMYFAKLSDEVRYRSLLKEVSQLLLNFDLKLPSKNREIELARASILENEKYESQRGKKETRGGAGNSSYNPDVSYKKELDILKKDEDELIRDVESEKSKILKSEGLIGDAARKEFATPGRDSVSTWARIVTEFKRKYPNEFKKILIKREDNAAKFGWFQMETNGKNAVCDPFTYVMRYKENERNVRDTLAKAKDKDDLGWYVYVPMSLKQLYKEKIRTIFNLK